MSAPPPPSYNESMQQGQNFPAGYQTSYGSVQPPAGAYHPQGAYDPSKSSGGYNSPPQYPPQAGYPPNQGYPPPPAGSVPTYQHQHNVVVSGASQSVVVVGGCPACRVGVLEDDFTCCGVVCAILFFPLGILCCLAMRQRRCVHCGAVFG